MSTKPKTSAAAHRLGAVGRGPLVPTLAASGLGIWTAVSLFSPFTPSPPQVGLDASWVAAMGEAADRGLRWGVDLAFTYGPASSLVTGYSNGAYLPVTLPLLLATCLLFGASAAMLARRGGDGFVVAVAVALGIAAACAAGHPDSFFLVLPLAPFLLVLAPERPGLAGVAVAAAVAFAVGAVGMAKMSFPLSALPLFLLGDLAAALRRRAPVLVAACLLGLIAADLVYGQSLLDLPAFLRMQGEVVAGYSEGMSLDGSRPELLAFPLVSALLVLAIGAAEWRSACVGRSRLAVPLGLAWVALLLFKAGFVRQDAHTLIAWHGLALAAVLAAAGRLDRMAAAGIAAPAVLGSAALGLTLLGPAASPGDRWAAGSAAAHRILLVKPSEQLGAALDLLRDPSGFADAMRAEQRQGWSGIAAAGRLPRLDGGVDVIPSQQSRIIANGLDYRPRPSLQEYGTYTPALLGANSAFLHGPRAPEWVLFGPESDGGLTLDSRYPNFAEGALWLDLLELYRPERRSGELAILRRRADPAPLTLGAPERHEVGFDEPVAVEPIEGVPGRRAVLATVDVRPTPLGRLAAFLYKPAPLTMGLRFADGHEELYQFISGIASAGFVLSPRVDDASEFEGLYGGPPPRPQRVVTALTLHAPSRLRALLDPRISVTLRAVSGPATPSRPAPDSAWAALADSEDLAPAARDFAVPVPSSNNLPVVGLSRLDLRFGLALADDAPPGAEKVCFAVSSAGRGGRALWRRCLDRAVAADRDPQVATLPLPSDISELVLTTTCEAGCGEGVGAFWAPP